MDSNAALKLIKLFYETPRAQEIYKSLRQQREDVRRANNLEGSFLDVSDELVQDKVSKLSAKKNKVTVDNAPPHEPNQESKQECEKSCDEQTMAETLSQCEGKLSQVFENIKLNDSVLGEDQKQRELLKWSLKIVNDEEIIVEGQRSGDPPDISWRTSIICDRMSTNVVQSKKGTLYFLLGEINENDMIRKNFSQEIINMFKYGFPPNWREIFSMISNQHERDYNVHNKKITPETTNDIRNAVVYEDTDTIHDMNEASLQTDNLPRKSNSSGNAEGKDSTEMKITSLSPATMSSTTEAPSKLHATSSLSSKPRTKSLPQPPKSRSTSSAPPSKSRSTKSSSRSRTQSPPPKFRPTKSPSKSRTKELSKSRTTLSSPPAMSRTTSSSKPRTTPPKPRKKSRTKKLNHSDTIDENDTQEIQVQRSRSGRLIVPVLDYWRGQRICTSPDPEDGEITVIKSNLEEDSRLMLVEPSRNSSGLLQNPTIFSSTPTSQTNQSDTDWVPSLTGSNSSSKRSPGKQNSTRKVSLSKTASLGAQSQPDEATQTDSVEARETRSFHRRKSEKETKTTGTSRNTHEDYKIHESETSSVEQSNFKRPKRTNTRKSNTMQKRSEPNMCVDEASDSNCDSSGKQSKRSKRRPKERKASYPLRTRIQPRRQININEKSSSKMNPTTLIIDDAEEKKTTSSRRPQNESHSQHLKNSKAAATGKMSSKTGSLARKRELREMLEEQDKGYEDDAFEGTPFRSKKISKATQHKLSPVTIGDVFDVDNDIQDENDQTTSGRTPMNRLRPAGPLSTGKSEIDTMTPGLLNSINRDNVDRYVNQLKRQRLYNLRKKLESHIPLPNKPTKNSEMGNVDYSFNVQKSTVIDDDESEDYYWSDNE